MCLQVKSGNVFAVDANTYFARPSPSLAPGAALVARCAFADQPAVATAIEGLGFLPPGSAWIQLSPFAAEDPKSCAMAEQQENVETEVDIEDCWMAHAKAVAAGEQVSALLIYQSSACSTDLLTIFYCCTEL